MPRSDFLDCYRGMGILAVLWGHAGLAGPSGAYLFIDTFFVISGFLVTRSLAGALARGLAGQEGAGAGATVLKVLWAYLLNRFHRIAVPLAMVVLLTLAAGWLIFLPDDLYALALSARATLFLQAHIYGQGLGDYFTTVRGAAPLLHSWSLSLEEWFYLITPLAVLPALLWPRLWPGLVFAVILLSLYHADSLSRDPEAFGASYMQFTTRLWQFLTGSLAALMLRESPKLPPWLNDGLLLGGLALNLGSILILTQKSPSPGLLNLPLLLGILPLLILRPQSPGLQWIAARRLPVFFGRRLYSLYLAHYPVAVFWTYLHPSGSLLSDLGKFLASVLAGLVIYRLTEAPVRGWRELHPGVVPAIFIALVAPALWISSHILQTGGAVDRLPPAALTALEGRFAVNPDRAGCMAGQLTRFGYSCAYGSGEGPFIALMGDSHSDMIAPALATSLAARGFGLRHYWYAECPLAGSGLAATGVFSAECAKASHEAHQALLAAPDLAGVIYAARWPWYLDDAGTQHMRAYWRDARGLARGYEDQADFRRDLIGVIEASARAFGARGVPVSVLSPVAVAGQDPVRPRALAAWRGIGAGDIVTGIARAEYHESRRSFDEAFAPLFAAETVQLLESATGLCDAQSCQIGSEGQSFYTDDNHLNLYGAARLIRGLSEAGAF